MLGGFLVSFANLAADTENADTSQQRESKLLLNYGLTLELSPFLQCSGLIPCVISAGCWELCLRADCRDWNHIWKVAAVH